MPPVAFEMSLAPKLTAPKTTLPFINPPTLIQYKEMRFLIIDAPSDNSLHFYLKEFKRYNVTDVVRVCDPTYNKGLLVQNGIRVHDWAFFDEEAPPAVIVNDWLDLVERTFGQNIDSPANPVTIAIHCVAGLGRAPILVAIALIEAGMLPLDSVLYIRERRRGAFNSKQFKFIENYRRRSRGRCVIF